MNDWILGVLLFVTTADFTANILTAIRYKTLLVRIERMEGQIKACEYKLRQLRIPGVEDEFIDENEPIPFTVDHPRRPGVWE